MNNIARINFATSSVLCTLCVNIRVKSVVMGHLTTLVHSLVNVSYTYLLIICGQGGIIDMFSHVTFYALKRYGSLDVPYYSSLVLLIVILALDTPF